MLNIISKSYVSKEITGPKKVVDNLIKGLDILGYPYCINKDLTSTTQLWIHDDKKALKQASKLNINAVVGPNIYIVPREIPSDINMDNFVYLHPSNWVCDFWKYLDFNKCPLESWPVGIDTNEFYERSKPEDGIVLVYFKQRKPEDLNFVKKILQEKKIKYDIIIYGLYEQNEYIKKLENTKYIIWIGTQESQGIALEEALSMNIPIIVWNINNIQQFDKNGKIIGGFSEKEYKYNMVTSAYYFDNRCGILLKDKNTLDDSITKMEIVWKDFKPREYIVDNLNLKDQAEKLIRLFDKYFNISYEDGLMEKIKNERDWYNNTVVFKIKVYIKTQIKKCVKLLKIMIK